MTDYDWKQISQSYLVEVEKECFYFVKNSHGNAATTFSWLVLIRNSTSVQSETKIRPSKNASESEKKPWTLKSGLENKTNPQYSLDQVDHLQCSIVPPWLSPWHLENLIIDWHGPYDGFIFIDWSSPFQILPEGKRRRASVRHRAATAQVMWLGSIHTTAACPVVPTRIVSRQRVGPLSMSVEGAKSTTVETTMLPGYRAPNLLNLLKSGWTVSPWSPEGWG